MLAPSADVECGARWILARLMDHRRLLPGRPEGPPTEEELAPHLPLVRAALAGDEPLSLLLPAFPAKSPNPQKVLGTLPDMAEKVALRSLQSLCDELATAHPPGVRLTLCSDGLVFADVVGVSDADVAAYGAEIDAILAGLPALRRFDLAHAFGAAAPGEARRRLLAGWGEEEAALLGQVEASPSLRAQLDGMHRFMFEDDIVLAKDTSRTQVRKHARHKAVAVLLRSRAWGRLLASCFPSALRLSIHPQPPVSDKLGVHLLPTPDAWLTPWHGVALLESDRFRLVKRAEAEARGAARVDVDGRPSHYVVAS
jgi:pyoverdine/dityrosine biosynthesis protein Dit1